QALANAGCNIIVDDVSYFSEGAFQDDVIAQAVDTVTAQGVFYFSAAGNNGNLRRYTGGTWQGDFADSGTIIADGSVFANVHSFGATNYDTLSLPSTVAVSGGGEGAYELMWSDPLGGSTNDYDLFITDSSGNVVASSTNIQNGTQDPEEDIIGSAAVFNACISGTCRILIVKQPAASARALYLSAEHGVLSVATGGATYGHAAAAAAFGVGATNGQYGDPAYRANCNGFSTSCNNGIESYSSDGPRQMFFNPDGSEITPGNYLFSTHGGSSMAKPDFAAADNIATAVPGYTAFTGTSAAAAHAAAIAALLLEAAPGLSATAMRAALASGAVAVAPAANAGAGAIMAPAAITAACGYSIVAPPSIGANDSSAGLSIQAGQSCPWTINGMPAWLSGTASGTGPSTITLAVTANSGSARSATLSLSAGTLSTSASASITQAAPQDAAISGSVALAGSPLDGVTITLSGAQNATAVTAGGVYSFGVNSGNMYTVTPSLANYVFNPAAQTVTAVTGNQTLNFTALELQSITFGALGNAVYGAAPFTLGATASSGLGVTYASSVPSVCTVSGNTVTVVGAGGCSIVASQTGNATFAAASAVTQSFTVTQAPQSITFGALNNVSLGVAPVALGATASSGLPVTYASNTPSVCAVAGSTATIVAAGGCAIVASQAGNANYAVASPVTQSFTVGQAGQTIAFGPLPNRTYGAAPFGVSAMATSGLPVAFNSATPAVCAVSNTTVTVVSVGTCSLVANQAGNANYAVAPAVTQSFAVNPASQNINFGPLPNVTLNSPPVHVNATASSGLAVSFASTTTPVCTVAGSTVAMVSAGTCSITASQAGNADYSAAAPVTQRFSVTQHGGPGH
ncbi:MAG TPA: S8 family serine peptidase, partial [Bryobacteraceae bacterium]|nr:S8 family serine peptidase [Bryobacteraceae bacterium]